GAARLGESLGRDLEHPARELQSRADLRADRPGRVLPHRRILRERAPAPGRIVERAVSSGRHSAVIRTRSPRTPTSPWRTPADAARAREDDRAVLSDADAVRLFRATQAVGSGRRVRKLTGVVNLLREQRIC